MKLLIFILSLNFAHASQVSLQNVNGRMIYVTTGSIVCRYLNAPQHGVMFDFDVTRSGGFDKALTSYIRDGVVLKAHHRATVKFDLMTSAVGDYTIDGEISGVKYRLTMNRESKIGSGSHYKGEGVPPVRLNCEYK